MGAVMIAGVVMSGAGLLGVLASGLLVARAKGELAGDEAALKARLNRILPLNLVAFGVAILGLMTVAVGGILGL